MNMKENNIQIKYLPGKTDQHDPNKWLPVRMHLEDTAGIMEKLVLYWLSPNISNLIDSQMDTGDISGICKLLGYLHDIGKFTPVFASRILEKLPEIRLLLEKKKIDIPEASFFLHNSPHALAGQCILHERNIPAGISIIVGAHHGIPQETYKPIDEDDKACYPGNYYGKKGTIEPYKHQWDEVWDQWIQYSLEKCGFRSIDELPVLDQSAQMLLTGLLIMADWIASNTAYFPLIDIESAGERFDYPKRVENAWEKFTKDKNEIWSSELFWADSELFSERFKDAQGHAFIPNDVQAAFMDVLNRSSGSGIFILEAPMGYGKTESALFAAEVLAAKTGVSGIFFGLPTQATANGIFPRLLRWAESQSEDAVHSIRLAHGMADLNDDYRDLFDGEAEISDTEEGKVIVHEWFRGRKQALLSDFVIGTVDQMLLAGLSRKHVMLRHLGLAGKVVIIDECHAYDAYMNHYMDCVLRWLGSYGVPVIILSATLPAKRRGELITAYVGEKMLQDDDERWKTTRGYPLLTWTDGEKPYSLEISYNGKQTSVFISKIEDNKIAETISEMLSDGGCAGLIANTVQRAQTLADEIEQSVPDVDVLVFHSQFIAADRSERERKLLELIGKNSTPELRSRLVIVGTQVLEQSLDIDFDYLITDLCPMDLLLQRIGRLHRHDRIRPDKLKQAKCAVLGSLDDEFLRASRFIYGDWMLEQTKKLLPDVITLPKDIPELVQEAYKDSDQHEDDWNEYIMNILKKQGKADQFCIPLPSNSRKKTIKGLLNSQHPGNTQTAEASVRDGIQTISVLVMRRYMDATIGFLPWSENGAKVPGNSQPSFEEARKIARQKLDLPYMFNIGLKAMDVITELENTNKTVLPEWQRSGLLKGELVLLLDENNQAELCGYHLTYDQEKGLIVTVGKEEKNSYEGYRI